MTEPVTDGMSGMAVDRATLPQDGPTDAEAPPARCLNGDACGWTGDVCPECSTACPRHPTPGCALCRERKQASLEASRRGGMASAVKRANAASSFRAALGDLLTAQDALRWMAEIPKALLDGTISTERAGALRMAVDAYLKAVTATEAEATRAWTYEDSLEELGPRSPSEEEEWRQWEAREKLDGKLDAMRARMVQIENEKTVAELQQERDALDVRIAARLAEVTVQPVPTEAASPIGDTPEPRPQERHRADALPEEPVAPWEPMLIRTPPEHRWSHMRPTQHED